MPDQFFLFTDGRLGLIIGTDQPDGKSHRSQEEAKQMLAAFLAERPNMRPIEDWQCIGPLGKLAYGIFSMRPDFNLFSV